MPISLARAGAAAAALLLSAGISSAATPVATYNFNNSLSANEGGAPALSAVDPDGVATFATANVFGHSQTVYQWGGTTTPADQGGLSLDTTGLIASDNYSVEFVFQFFDRANAWRRILDVQNRSSDDGFYVNPGNNLDVFDDIGSSDTFTNNAFHYVVLTDSGGMTNAYLDGVHELTDTNPTMNINNSGNLMNLFLDNNQGGGIGEWSAGQIALFRVSQGALSAGDVTDNFNTLNGQGPGPSGVPLPAAFWPTMSVIAFLIAMRARKALRPAMV